MPGVISQTYRCSLPMLCRAVAGTRGSSLILNLPGSEKAARENLAAVIGALEYAMHMIAAEGHDETRK